MIPDLGKYAVEVMSAYAASLLLLATLIVLTVRKGRAARAFLKDVEAQVKPDA